MKEENDKPTEKTEVGITQRQKFLNYLSQSIDNIELLIESDEENGGLNLPAYKALLEFICDCKKVFTDIFPETPTETCKWKWNEKDKLFNTDCEVVFTKNFYGIPIKMDYWRYCPYCGKPIEIEREG